MSVGLMLQTYNYYYVHSSNKMFAIKLASTIRNVWMEKPTKRAFLWPLVTAKHQVYHTILGLV